MQPGLQDTHLHIKTVTSTCHGVQSESQLTASPSKAFCIEVSALNSEVHLFCNGSTVDLSHERYL